MKKIAFRFLLIFVSVVMFPLGSFFYNYFVIAETPDLKIYDTSTEKVVAFDEEEFLVGALFAQIDPKYNVEALKAQAVIIKTNTAFYTEKNQSEDFDLVADLSCEYSTEEARKERYGDEYGSLLEKVKKAVSDVRNTRVTYNSKAVLLPFFKLSTGKTEDSSVVWGEKIEYLKPVISEGDELSPNFKTTYNIPLATFFSAINDKYGVSLSGEAIQINSRTDAGTVKSCSIGSLTMTGQEFRSLFSLCSANFDISCSESSVEIICYGNGHFVGMSQYGADFLARQGSNYIEILKHYYTGIEIN